MPGLCPRAPGIPAYERAYQTITSSAINNKQEQAVCCFFLMFGALRAEFSSVVTTNQICLIIINIFQAILNFLY